ncbi:hypothetical protein HK405_015119, partial [Cladochytrium tenue]
QLDRTVRKAPLPAPAAIACSISSCGLHSSNGYFSDLVWRNVLANIHAVPSAAARCSLPARIEPSSGRDEGYHRKPEYGRMPRSFKTASSASNSHFDTVDALLAHGADMDTANDKGETPPDIAADDDDEDKHGDTE